MYIAGQWCNDPARTLISPFRPHRSCATNTRSSSAVLPRQCDRSLVAQHNADASGAGAQDRGRQSDVDRSAPVGRQLGASVARGRHRTGWFDCRNGSCHAVPCERRAGAQVSDSVAVGLGHCRCDAIRPMAEPVGIVPLASDA